MWIDEGEVIRVIPVRQILLPLFAARPKESDSWSVFFSSAKRIGSVDRRPFLARQLNAVLVHKDTELEALNGAVDLEALPYK